MESDLNIGSILVSLMNQADSDRQQWFSMTGRRPSTGPCSFIQTAHVIILADYAKHSISKSLGPMPSHTLYLLNAVYVMFRGMSPQKLNKEID